MLVIFHKEIGYFTRTSLNYFFLITQLFRAKFKVCDWLPKDTYTLHCYGLDIREDGGMWTDQWMNSVFPNKS